MPKINYGPVPNNDADAPNLGLDGMESSSTLRTCMVLGRLLYLIVSRFRKLCAAVCLVLFLFYWIFGGYLTITFLLTSIFGIFYYAQDILLYYPLQPPNARTFVESPGKFQLPFESVFVKTSDGVSLHMYLIKHPESVGPHGNTFPTIVMFHGNAGNIGHRLVLAYYIFNMCQCNVLMPEYRGYGKSSGSPSETGFYKDAETTMMWLKERTDIDQNKIFLYGCSLGGAVSIKLASDPRYMSSLAGVILENTFTSLREVALSLFQWRLIKILPTFCFKNKFLSIDRIGSITIPTLFLSGQNDDLIPPCMMSSLYNLSGSTNKLLVPFEGGTHNETFLCKGFFEAFAQFVHSVSENAIKAPKESTALNMRNIDNTII